MVVKKGDSGDCVKGLVSKSKKFRDLLNSKSVEDVLFEFHQDHPYHFKRAKNLHTEEVDSDISLLDSADRGFITPPQNHSEIATKEDGCSEFETIKVSRKEVDSGNELIDKETIIPVEEKSKGKINKGSLIKIHSVCNINDAVMSELQEIASVFKVDITNLGDRDEMKEAITNNHLYTSKFGMATDCYFCFGNNSNYICALVDFNKNEHRVMIPGIFEHASVTSEDIKIMVLLQLLKYDIDGKADLLWKDLLLPQIRDIGKEYDISFKKGDNVNRLKQKIEKAAGFKRLFGDEKVENLIYSFDKMNPYTCTEVRMDSTANTAPIVAPTEDIESPADDTTNPQIGATPKASSHSSRPPRNIQKDILETKAGEIAEIKVSELTGELMVKLLDVFELNGNSINSWESNWAILQCSKYFLKKFGGYDAKDILVEWKDNKLINVKSLDGSVTLEGNKSIYPCTQCCKEVTDQLDTSGTGLQCNKCNRYFHNSCMDNPVSSKLYDALTNSPEYIQIFCPDCMTSKDSMEKISVDVDTIRKGITDVTYATRLNSGIVNNVKEAVVNMENTTKTQSGLIKLIPQRQSAEINASIQKNREEKLSKTMIVIKPKAHVNNSSEIRKEFNRKFPDVALTLAVSTASGSVRLEFQNNTIRNEVAKKWELDLFGGNAGIRIPTLKPTIGIIKQMDLQENTEDIIDAVQQNYADTQLDFFKRNGKLTGTVKIIFKDHNLYNKAMNDGGLRICGVKYSMEQYISKPKVIRCYKCQNYGHIATKCRAKESRCGRCCQSGHESIQCQSVITNPRCIHCKGDHPTGSKICKEFKTVEDKLQLLYNSNGL